MKKILFMIIYFLVILNIYAEDNNSLKIILTQLHKNYDNITTFKADFTQYSFFKAVNQVQKFSGTLYLKKPDKMKWDYISPEQQIIMSNGKKMWYYYPADNQVNIGTLSKSSKQKNLIFMLLDGIKKVENEFNLKLIKGKEDKKFYYLQLTPKKPNTLFDKIILTIGKDNFNITTSHVFYLSGDIAKIIFKKVFLNIELNDNFFNFKLPPGVEVFKIPSYR